MTYGYRKQRRERKTAEYYAASLAAPGYDPGEGEIRMSVITLLILKDRNIDMMDEKYLALVNRIISALNELDDSELIDVLRGLRGSFNLLPTDRGAFKLACVGCICGSIENIPCQWLEKGQKCEGSSCAHFERDDISGS